MDETENKKLLFIKCRTYVILLEGAYIGDDLNVFLPEMLLSLFRYFFGEKPMQKFQSWIHS